MKPGSTIILPKSKNSPNNRHTKVLRHQGRQTRFFQQERLWQLFFWDSHGIILIDYLEKGKTINGEYYATLLQQLSDKIKEKRSHLVKKKVLFYQDRAPAHKSAIAMAKIHELVFELVPHSAYSLDLTPSDYHLFPNLKKWFGGKRFSINSEVIAAVNCCFEDLDSSTYKEGIANLEYRWNNCVERAGDYIEK